MTYATKQEDFWAGSFGDAYIDRNRSAALMASNRHWFARVLAHAPDVGSVLELGANIGMNLRALSSLLPGVTLDAVEVNAQAAEELRRLELGAVEVGTLLDLNKQRSHDLVFTKTVLIHIDPDRLSTAYDVIAAASKRYVLLAEYYNPSPMQVPYRGHVHQLFKRDFAGEFCARHSDFKLRHYEFSYRGDAMFPQDDITWFLLERSDP